MLLEDISDSPASCSQNQLKDQGLTSFAGYKLTSTTGDTIGVLALFSTRPLLEDEDALLQSLASTASWAIQAAQNEDEMRRRNRDLTLLNQLGRELAATLDLQQLTERLLEAVMRTIGAEAVSVWLTDEEYESGWLVCLAAYPA